MEDRYNTVAREMIAKCKIRRSLFIGHVRETSTEKKARDYIAQIKEEHKQATHNCYAYRIGLGKDELSYFDDDGEPGGTAGKPILGAILSRDLTNVTVIVTRYFGGRKLGIRGLIEAYGAAAGDAMDHAGIVEKRIREIMDLTCTYPQLDQVQHLIHQYQGKIIGANYTDKVELTIAVPRSRLARVRRLLAEIGV
ncbi:MAG: YigZ family protein [Firmicutes bacterium]|nr:YigZ family protein [Bacillota bacterium]